MRCVQIVIVSEVTMCKQCLQTASASGDPRPSTGDTSLDLTVGIRPPDPLGCSPQMKIRVAAIAVHSNL